MNDIVNFSVYYIAKLFKKIPHYNGGRESERNELFEFSYEYLPPLQKIFSVVRVRLWATHWRQSTYIYYNVYMEKK